MAEVASRQQIQAAAAYEELLVPALFEEWAPRVASAAALSPDKNVLDVACGTGVLAREVAAWVGETGVVGLDRDPGMLAIARRLAPRLRWCNGSAEELPFPDERFDAVVSQFGLMFFADRTQALREMMRVLVPAGRLVVAVWDSLTNTPVYAIEVELLDRIAGREAADALRAPFALGDRNELANLFEDAGVGCVTVTTHQGKAQFPSVRSMVEADLRGWLPVMGINLPEDQIASILESAEKALSPYVTGQGKLRFDSPAHIVTGNRPPTTP